MRTLSDNRPIGVMDSGVGGLTVVKALRQLLPQEEIIYVGDEKNCPYGPRSQEEVKTFVEAILNTLLQQDIKMFIIACNTATAAALPELQEKVDIPIIGMIDNGSVAAVNATKCDHIAVLATEGTVKSGSYVDAIHQLNPHIQVLQVACPQFVTLVETEQTNSSKAQQAIRELLTPVKESGVDTAILGCTHFPIMRSQIQDFLGSKIQLIDAGAASSQKAKAVLTERQQLRDGAPQPLRLFTTGNLQHFSQIAQQWLAEDEMQIAEIQIK